MDAQKERFLAAFRNAGTIRRACERSNVPRASVNEWLAEEGAFVAEYELAWEDFVDSILDTMIALGRGTTTAKTRPNFTALIAMLNAFHDDFRTMGKEALESKLSQAVDVIAAIAQKYIPPHDLPKFREECDAAAADAALGIRRKGRRE